MVTTTVAGIPEIVEPGAGVMVRPGSGFEFAKALHEVLADRDAAARMGERGLEVIREYLDAQGKPVTQIKMGDRIDVRLKFRATGGKYVPSIAFVDRGLVLTPARTPPRNRPYSPRRGTPLDCARSDAVGPIPGNA